MTDPERLFVEMMFRWMMMNREYPWNNESEPEMPWVNPSFNQAKDFCRREFERSNE